MKRIKALKAVTSLPYVTRDGIPITVPGYNADTKVFATFREDAMKSFPEHPTKHDLVMALRTIWQPWAGYIFANENDRAAMFAAILTAVCRPALGAAPGFFFDAPVQASGKTKCASALGALVQGVPVGVCPFVDSAESEIAKKLVSMTRNGDSFWLIDNVVGTWRSPTIAALLTNPTISDRVLGGNVMYRGESRMMVCATGNNAALDTDLGRRMIRVRIDPGVETPQSRAFDFDPAEVALANRMEIARAVLVVFQAFRHQQLGRISKGDAGFYEWNRLIRECVLWVGTQDVAVLAEIGTLGDPGATILEDASANDPDVVATALLLEGLFKCFQSSPFKTSEVITVFERGMRVGRDEPEGLVREAIVTMLKGATTPSVGSLGKVLGNRRGRIVHGLRLNTLGKTGNSAMWIVEEK